MFFNYFLFCVAHYHTNRVCAITQFCHTRLAWIVCIIGSCGQYEAICCEITRPCGGMVDRLHTAPPPAWLPILRPRYLKCMQHFCFHGLGEKLRLFNLPILITDFLISSLFSTWSRFALKKKKNTAEVFFCHLPTSHPFTTLASLLLWRYYLKCPSVTNKDDIMIH